MAETNLARHLCHLWLEDVSIHGSIDSSSHGFVSDVLYCFISISSQTCEPISYS